MVAATTKLPRSSWLLSLTPDRSIGSGGGTVTAGCAGVVLVESITLGGPCTADSRGAEVSGVSAAGGALVDDDSAGAGAGLEFSVGGTTVDELLVVDDAGGLISAAGGGGEGRDVDCRG